ncbi:MAG: hypothetical protein HC883_00055 [Bdellovibrionaceae bacterium]|nr:hypothetical protein [Pseudobdellovibrionaceae bacterium]
MRMTTGRFKVFQSCTNWLFEKRLYRRDEKGRIVKENDHAMDDSRYMVMSGLERMKTKPLDKPNVEDDPFGSGRFGRTGGGRGWMGG